MAYVERQGLSIDAALSSFIEGSALPGTGISPARFWLALSELVSGFAAENRRLLARRDQVQVAIDGYHLAHAGKDFSACDYQAFLREIGYIEPAGPAFRIDTAGTDPEISALCGPQLVVPVMNARYALNAANARWGSLYDGFYGTDALDGQPPPAGPFDPVRAGEVVARVKAILDKAAPLTVGGHGEAGRYHVEDGRLAVTLVDGSGTGLIDPTGFAGYRGDPAAPEAILLVRHGLHLEIVLDRQNRLGAADPAGVADVMIEAALTTIIDFEDSVAAVDAADKVLGYGNWLGLMNGTLSARFEKGGRALTRKLAGDRHYTAPEGEPLALKGRSLMLVRNVGALIETDAVLDGEGRPIPESLLDALVTAMIALHDVGPKGRHVNSATGAVYIVKPKMHGAAEVAFANRLFGAVEDALGLARYALKMGIMDEERRTSVNLSACIAAARHRVFFINTGFLDRTGDEIHTSMLAGPMVRKGEMKSSAWIAAYEDGNVDAGLAAGLPGRAQIGKGMWAAPDKMAAMLAEKGGHPRAGASTAWVPSPTAAALHALHYLEFDVAGRQRALAGRARNRLDELLTIPLGDPSQLSAEEIAAELDNNAQGILGYVVRWIDQGVGCSKVPDIDDVGRMEDRATLRISSQHMANWLKHKVVSEEEVLAAFARMAAVVDRQNHGDPAYRPMAGALGESIAYQAALRLVREGTEQPNGYTELILHQARRQRKAEDRIGNEVN